MSHRWRGFGRFCRCWTLSVGLGLLFSAAAFAQSVPPPIPDPGGGGIDPPPLPDPGGEPSIPPLDPHPGNGIGGDDPLQDIVIPPGAEVIRSPGFLQKGWAVSSSSCHLAEDGSNRSRGSRRLR